MKYSTTKEVRNGIRWLEANGGEYDLSFDPKRGWVSIDGGYVMNSDRDPRGVRWKLTEEEIAKIPEADRLWCEDNWRG
tara:strand:- start:591 stop:824 length:234 start_codon:yes stop_codon:yes gene_type:complete